jgi:hypothetical protein
MSIQKKSLISTLKTAKKAKVASAPLAEVQSGKNEKRPVKMLARVTGRALSKTYGKSAGARMARFAKIVE